MNEEKRLMLLSNPAALIWVIINDYQHRITIDELNDWFDSGVDIDFRTEFGNTLLILAIESGASLPIIQVILNRNPNLNIQNNDGITALMMAIDKGVREIIQALLDRTPNVNIQDNDGDTSLMRAIYRNAEPDLIQAILDKNPNLYIKNHDGYDVFMLAKIASSKISAFFQALRENLEKNAEDLVEFQKMQDFQKVAPLTFEYANLVANMPFNHVKESEQRAALLASRSCRAATQPSL